MDASARAAARFYDEVADAYADHLGAGDAESAIDMAMIDHFLSLLPRGARVLDAGCGAGRMLAILGRDERHVEGVDVAPAMIRRAALECPGVPLRVADLAHLPHANHAFDAVFSWYSTIHAPGPQVESMLREFHRVLRPGGFMLVAFQTGDGARTVGEAFRRMGLNVTIDRHHRSPAAMDAMLESCGFAVAARLSRDPAARLGEVDGQAMVIARAAP